MTRRATGGRFPSDRAELYVDLLLALSVVGSMLAIGTAYPAILLVVAMPVVAALLVAVGPWFSESPRLGAPALIAVVLALYTLVQALPLPASLLNTLTPLNADVWQRALLPFGSQGSAWASISLDPGASYVEVLK